MLGRLMKYELKAVGRVMLPLYGAWIIMSVLMGFTFGIANDFMMLGKVVVGLLYTVVSVAVVVLTVILIIQRFYKNLLGDEGYMMFTLPVKASTHVWNKTISASIWIVLGTVMGFVSIGGMYLVSGSPVNLLSTIGDFFSTAANNIGVAGTILVMIEIIVMLLLVAGEAVIKVYAAISVGHLTSSHRIISAIGAYIGFGIVEIILVNLLNQIWGNINGSDILNKLIKETGSLGQIQIIMLIMFVLVGILFAIYYLITYKILNKKLNLE